MKLVPTTKNAMTSTSAVFKVFVRMVAVLTQKVELNVDVILVLRSQRMEELVKMLMNVKILIMNVSLGVIVSTQKEVSFASVMKGSFQRINRADVLTPA
jgi:hypothetical protein